MVTMKRKMRVCHSCGIKRDDCKPSFEGIGRKLWICRTCTDGVLPISPACQEQAHKSCKVEACYCKCHPECNELD